MINFSSAPTVYIAPHLVEPIVFDHRCSEPIPYSQWLKFNESELLKQGTWRPYVHI